MFQRKLVKREEHDVGSAEGGAVRLQLGLWTKQLGLEDLTLAPNDAVTERDGTGWEVSEQSGSSCSGRCDGFWTAAARWRKRRRCLWVKH